MAALKNYDRRYDQAAASLGTPPWRSLMKVTFPLLRAGLVAAFLFAFITSFDELTIALFVTGGLTTTLPKQMWDAGLLRITPTLAAVSTLLLVFISAVILVAERLQRKRWGLGALPLSQCRICSSARRCRGAALSSGTGTTPKSPLLYGMLPASIDCLATLSRDQRRGFLR